MPDQRVDWERQLVEGAKKPGTDQLLAHRPATALLLDMGPGLRADVIPVRDTLKLSADCDNRSILVNRLDFLQRMEFWQDG